MLSHKTRDHLPAKEQRQGRSPSTDPPVISICVEKEMDLAKT